VAHSTHLQPPKTYREVKKNATDPSLGSKCTSSVQSLMALTQLNIALTRQGDLTHNMRPTNELILSQLTPVAALFLIFGQRCGREQARRDGWRRTQSGPRQGGNFLPAIHARQPRSMRKRKLPPFKVRIDGSVFCRYRHPAWFASPRRRGDDCLEIVRCVE
jgi:hypothetical protein